MTTLSFPSVYTSPNISDYFTAFYKLNEHRDFFSFRYFANKIGWPLGYANDLISGRRRLTINRCLEFIEFSGMDPIESDGFVFLCLKNNLDEEQKQLLEKKLPTSRGPELIDDGTEKQIFRAQSNLIVFSILKWCKINLTPEQIKELIPFVDISVAEIKNSVQLLIDEKVIQISDDKMHIEILKADLMVDEPINQAVGNLHEDFAKSALNYYLHRSGPATLNCGFLELPRARFQEVTQKFLAFRNWLIDYSAEFSNRSKKSSLDENLVFQFDLNLYPVIDKNKAKAMTADQNKLDFNL